MTPRSAPVSAVRWASAGVGTTPASSTSAPALVSPATTAASSISPLARGSRPTTATGRTGPARAGDPTAGRGIAADGRDGTRSPAGVGEHPGGGTRHREGQLRREVGVGPTPDAVGPEEATQRTYRSALGVLRRLAGLLEAVLLALLDPRVTGEEARLLESRTVVGLDLDEGAGDRQAQRAGLPGDATTLEDADDVVLLALLEGHERLTDELLVHLVREVLLEGAAVELELAGAGQQPHADDGLLAPADGLDRTPLGVGHGQCAGHWATCLISKVWGCCAAWGCSGPAYTFSFLSICRPRLLCGSMPLTARSTTRSGWVRSWSPTGMVFRPPG